MNIPSVFITFVSFNDNSTIMKKIINPWLGMEGYHCFGCDPDHQHGLKMEFYEDGDDIVSFWEPDGEHQSWINTLHGGVQAALLDELCGWWCSASSRRVRGPQRWRLDIASQYTQKAAS